MPVRQDAPYAVMQNAGQSDVKAPTSRTLTYTSTMSGSFVKKALRSSVSVAHTSKADVIRDGTLHDGF